MNEITAYINALRFNNLKHKHNIITSILISLLVIIINTKMHTLNIITHRTIPITVDILFTTPASYPIAECRGLPADACWDNDPLFRYNIMRYGQMRWLNDIGNPVDPWHSLPGGRRILTSPFGQFIYASDKLRSWVAKKNSGFKPATKPVTTEDSISPNYITDAGDIVCNDKLRINRCYNVISGQSIDFPIGWHSNWGPYIVSSDPRYFILHRMSNVVNYHQEIALYDRQNKCILWKYILKSLGSTASLSLVYFSGTRSLLVVDGEVAVFDGAILLGTFICPNSTTSFTRYLRLDPDLTVPKWIFGDDGSVWAFDGTNVYIVLWRKLTPVINIVPYKHGIVIGPHGKEGETDSLCVWGDGKYIIHAKTTVLSPKIVQYCAHNSYYNYAREITLRMEERDIASYKVRFKPALRITLERQDRLSREPLDEHISFSKDGHYLLWKIGLVGEITHELFVFRLQ